ncbi:MAG: single-stranded-DNA-specific exonuclease RecJ [Candidatus Pacebacteria bacterium]|nr:single-stranded-DNA-specific exonuclease RecJ [Candidatus Paceibacterota bacterium]MBP9772625.1 single-stranded-DNA-specific exonuclease RecJ [Candidatus Paceibacterota bacterium]
MQSGELLKKLLENRGVDEGQIDSFLLPDYEKTLHDPFLFKDMERACVRIFEAIDQNQKIVVYADYDADGIPGAVIFNDFFQKIGYENFDIYIPDRHDEGYGLHKSAVDEFIKQGVSLIITVDLGITAVEEVRDALIGGVDVIITDHHLPHAGVPRAFAIINPKYDTNYPFDGLCGAGVAFKVVCALIKKYGEYWNIKEGWEKWTLDMAGLATLSDMVPLVGENRTIAYWGLHVMRKSPRPGLVHLFKKAGINMRYINEEDITFSLTPRLNAASRMASPKSAFMMLAEKDILKAQGFAEYLTGINDERKTIVASIMKDVHKNLEKRELCEVIVIGNPSWRVGVLGLVASKICETYKRPAFVWGREGGKEEDDAPIKGSCRSDGSVNIVELMQLESESFASFGGHEMAGGFSVKSEHIHFLEDKLVSKFSSIKRDVKIDDIIYDLELSISDINKGNYKSIDSLSPYGLGNPKPIFLFKSVKIESMKQFGKEKNHLEMIFSGGGKKVKAISFFDSPDEYGVLGEGLNVDLYATFELSRFAGKEELRLRIVDIK